MASTSSIEAGDGALEGGVIGVGDVAPWVWRE